MPSRSGGLLDHSRYETLCNCIKEAFRKKFPRSAKKLLHLGRGGGKNVVVGGVVWGEDECSLWPMKSCCMTVWFKSMINHLSGSALHVYTYNVYMYNMYLCISSRVHVMTRYSRILLHGFWDWLYT